MKKFLLFAPVALLLAACGKDKFETVPQVTVKSFGPETVVKGQVFALDLEITDKEGDLQDSIVLVRKRFTTPTIQVPPRRDDTTTVSLVDFTFPNTSKIEVKITFTYGEQVDGTQYYNIQEAVDRSVKYEIFVSDKAKNKAKPVETNFITLKKV